MSMRMKLALAMLACVLCLVILFTTDVTHQPFAQLSPDAVESFTVTGALGVAVEVDDADAIAELTAMLATLTLTNAADPEGEALALFTVACTDGITYEIMVYDAHVAIDGTGCVADPAQTAAFAAFAKKFA